MGRREGTNGMGWRGRKVRGSEVEGDGEDRAR